MIKNDHRDIHSFSSNMGFYLSLAQMYLHMHSDIVHLSKKDKDVKYELLYVL